LAEPSLISAEDAEEYTQSLGQIVGGSWRQIAWASRLGIPEALGLSTEDWVQQRLGGYVRLSVSERREAAKELTAPPDEGGMGMSGPQAADVLGVSDETVYRDLGNRSTNVAPESSDLPNPSETSTDVELGIEPETWPEQPDIPPWPDVTPEPEPQPAAEPPEPAKPAGAHVGKNSGDNEWYTPAEFIKAATAVMGGIDLDPASSEVANELIGAGEFYTAEDDGLTQPWAGRVWMNPPYAQPLVDRFCTRLAREYRDGAVEEACILVNNATETGWYQELATQASAKCEPRGRIKFWHPSKESAPLQGQNVIYLGPHVAEFQAEFLRFGPVWLAPGR
jgi:phage N-6-adenine-methyltransferase